MGGVNDMTQKSYRNYNKGLPDSGSPLLKGDANRKPLPFGGGVWGRGAGGEAGEAHYHLSVLKGATCRLLAVRSVQVGLSAQP